MSDFYNQIPMDRYLTISDASKFLGVSQSTLRNWDKRGRLIAYRHPINGYRLYLRAELEKFLKTVTNRS